MKHITFLTVALVIIASSVFAADFNPTTMKLSASEVISYDFQSTLKIPVTVTGTPASLYFLVYTKDKGEQIVDVRNGFLGWHYVNKIDTCIYLSSPYSFQPGNNEVTWNGTDSDGNAVPIGDYNYYMWAFDNQSARIKMTEFVRPQNSAKFIEVDESGQPLANPILRASEWRWVVGGDPDDETLLETTSIPDAGSFALNRGHTAVQFDDWSTFYMAGFDEGSGTAGAFKYNWVPQGESVRDDSFEVTWGSLNHRVTILTDGIYLYVFENNYKEFNDVRCDVHIIDYIDGVMARIYDFSDWWCNMEDYDAGGTINGNIDTMDVQNGWLYLGSCDTCIKMAIDPMEWFGDEDYLVKWDNRNGDYVMDKNFEEDSEKPWVCNDYLVGPYMYTYTADVNGFSASSSFDMGAVSFGLLAPDGTGIGYLAFAGETANQKYGVHFLDNDSAYDGLYSTVNTSAGDVLSGSWFTGSDSIKGVITSGVGVDENAPAAFVVAQNSPNPFNPTTTISFNLAEADDVTVEVFNVAGQKVDTILSGFMDAGSHSLVWDASDLSGGVYFYTVKAGDFSKTMKMTLLK